MYCQPCGLGKANVRSVSHRSGEVLGGDSANEHWAWMAAGDPAWLDALHKHLWHVLLRTDHWSSLVPLLGEWWLRLVLRRAIAPPNFSHLRARARELKEATPEDNIKRSSRGTPLSQRSHPTPPTSCLCLFQSITSRPACAPSSAPHPPPLQGLAAARLLAEVV
jgi:hypothetical protein